MSRHVFHEHNAVGRDYVVGDIHGQFPALRRLLQRVGFSTKTDRLFSVGDLVDRGPRSADCLIALAQPWFHTVMGNHEDLLSWCPTETIRRNGGAWFLALSPAEKEHYLSVFERLPLVRTIAVGDKRIGIVHAEVPGSDWPAFVEKLESNTLHLLDEEHAMWSRRLIGNPEHPSRITKGIDQVIVGHTVQEAPLTIGNHLYLDTGAGKQMTLSAICLQTGGITVEDCSAG